MIKRPFDLLFGLFALILSLPIMALSALMVYLEDGAPVIFRQTRVGKNGELFEMFKIRTMVKAGNPVRNSQNDLTERLIHKKRNDPRVTHVGRVLRRFSLDELPQLFN